MLERLTDSGASSSAIAPEPALLGAASKTSLSRSRSLLGRYAAQGDAPVEAARQMPLAEVFARLERAGR